MFNQRPETSGSQQGELEADLYEVIDSIEGLCVSTTLDARDSNLMPTNLSVTENVKHNQSERPQIRIDTNVPKYQDDICFGSPVLPVFEDDSFYKSSGAPTLSPSILFKCGYIPTKDEIKAVKDKMLEEIKEEVKCKKLKSIAEANKTGMFQTPVERNYSPNRISKSNPTGSLYHDMTLLKFEENKRVMLPPNLPHPLTMDLKRCRVHYCHIERVVKSLNLKQPYAYGFILNNILPQHKKFFERFDELTYLSDNIEWCFFEFALDDLYEGLKEAEDEKEAGIELMKGEMTNLHLQEYPGDFFRKHLHYFEGLLNKHESCLPVTFVDEIGVLTLDALRNAFKFSQNEWVKWLLSSDDDSFKVLSHKKGPRESLKEFKSLVLDLVDAIVEEKKEQQLM